MSKGAQVAAAVMAAVSLASCSTGSKQASPSTATSKTTASSTAPASPAPTTAPAPDLTSELLQVGDLPAGWSVDNSASSSSSSEPKCISDAKPAAAPTAQAQAAFQDGSNGLPSLSEELAYLPGKAVSALTAASTALASCKQATFTSGGYKFSGTFGQMSFPSIGQQSAAYQWNLSTVSSGLTITLGIDILVFRQGQTDGLLVYLDLGTPDLTAFESFARQAGTKLAG